MNEQQKWKLFWEIHKDNPREGPGNAESTQKAFGMLTDLPAKPRILDIGCGPGMQAIDLSRLTDGTITAIDNHDPFLDQLKKKVTEQGLEARVTVSRGDMFHLQFPEHSLDVIWAEGSIYFIGFEKGLREWKSLLKEGGYVAVSELTRLKSGAPEEGKAFWEGEYPAMQDVQGNLAIIERAGYRLVGHFTLPESAWWEYYEPILKKLVLLKDKYKNNAEALQVLGGEEKEIDMYRNFSKYYGYVFYVAQSGFNACRC